MDTAPPMIALTNFWVVRATVDGQDVSLVVECETAAEAERFAWKRGIPVVIVSEAGDADIAAAQQNKLLWRCSVPRRMPRCFGQPVGAVQMACLAICGVATMLLNLRSAGLLATTMAAAFPMLATL